MQECSSLLIGPGVVRAYQSQEIAFSLIGNHLDNVGQVFAFGSELDDGPFCNIADFDASWKRTTFGDKIREQLSCRTKFFSPEWLFNSIRSKSG